MAKDRFCFLVCFHKETPRINNGVFTSIHVGRALAKQSIPDTIGDDTGDNISHKNRSYCELTAMYWMFKNADAEYYGLFHYRRMLNFSGTTKPFFHNFSQSTLREFGWTEAGAGAVCDRFDIVTGPRWNVHPFEVPTLPMSNYHFYRREHHQKDMDTLLAVVEDRSPETFPYVRDYMAGTTCFYGNVFVMRRDHFQRYADWLFDLLFEVERRSDISGYDSYQGRVWGFLAERLMGAYIDYLSATEPVRIGQLPIVTGIFETPEIPFRAILRNIRQAGRNARKRPAAEPIHVAMEVDDLRSASCAVALRSAADQLPKWQALHIHLIIAGDLSSQNRRRFETFLGAPHEVVFHSLPDGDGPVPDLAAPQDRPGLLVLQEILPASVHRVIYLDSETLVFDNLDLLYALPLDGLPLAASQDEGGILQARRLNFPPTAGYFEAGVLLLDLDRLRSEDVGRLYREAYAQERPVIVRGAADILNIAFLGRYKNLDLRWNVTDRFYRRNELERQFSFAAACEAARNPAIVHFSGERKPQDRRCRHPLTMFYWLSLAKTPWRVARAKVARRVVRAALRALR